MKAAKVAGCDVSELPGAIEKSVAHMKKFATDTGFYYRLENNQKRDPSMRAVGVLCMQLLGAEDDPACRRLGNLIVKEDINLLRWEEHGRHSSPAGFYLY